MIHDLIYQSYNLLFVGVILVYQTILQYTVWYNNVTTLLFDILILLEQAKYRWLVCNHYYTSGQSGCCLTGCCYSLTKSLLHLSDCASSAILKELFVTWTLLPSSANIEYFSSLGSRVLFVSKIQSNPC